MKRLTIVQPFLFGAFPILSLLASNLNLVRPAEVLVPLSIVLAITAFLFFLATRLFGTRDGGAIVVSVFWLLFFSYGRFLALIGGAGAGREKLLLVAWGLLFASTIFAVIRWRRRAGDLAGILNVVGVALVAMPLVTVVAALVPPGGPIGQGARAPWQARARQERVSDRALELAGRGNPADAAATDALEPAKPAETVAAGTPALAAVPAEADRPGSATPAPSPTPVRNPDIYYIILDAYARADVLQEIYGYDNAAFLAGLQDRGFYVAGESRANYCQTYLSLASSLNMTYLDEVAESVGRLSEDRKPLQEMVKHNAVVDLLRERGYTYAAITTGYASAELKSADVFIAAPWSLTQFQSGLINTTPISPLIGLQYELHRERLLYALDHLADPADIEGPVFVLAHIAAPHPPFVFDADGGSLTPNREFLFSDGSHFMEEGTRAEYVEGYVGQVSFVSRKVEAAIDAILARSPDPPVIILQADHGPGSMLNWYDPATTNMKERMSILNAYYLPWVDKSRLYPGITPVNTFRLIFDSYFGAGLDLLQDESFFSCWDRPYSFLRVAED